MRNAIAYIRLSSKQQITGDGRHRQLQAIDDYCKVHNFKLIDTLEDLGISAFKGANKDAQWGLFVEGIRSGVISNDTVLLVESNDRISRQKPVDALDDFNGLIRMGLEIHTYMTGEIHSRATYEKDPMKLHMLLSTMIRANEESATKSKRILSAKQSQRKLALSDNVKITRNCPNWLIYSDKSKSFEIKKGCFNIIKRIFELNEFNGAYTIANTLNNDKVAPITTSKLWQSYYVKTILKNKAVYGSIEFTTGEIKDGYYPAVISKDEFDKAQYHIRQRKTKQVKGRNGDNLPNLFKGIAFCGFCNSTMVYVNKGMKYRYLRCSKALADKQSCIKAVNWVYQDVELMIMRFLTEVDLTLIFNKKSDTDYKARLLKIDMKCLELRDNIEQLSKLNVSSTNAKQQMLLQITDNDKQLTELENERDNILEKSNVNPEKLHLKLYKNIKSFEQRERLHHELLQVIDKIEVFTLPKNTNPAGSGGLSAFQTNDVTKINKLKDLQAFKERHCIVYFKNGFIRVLFDAKIG